MILMALAELAEKEHLVEDPSYEFKEVHYLIRLGPEGKYLGYSAPRDEPPVDAKGKARGKPRPKKLPIPKRSDRRAKSQADFLVDKAEYVLGIDPAGEREEDELVRRKQLFASFIDSAIQESPYSEGLRAIRAFLGREVPQEVRNLFLGESGSERVSPNSLFAFIYEPNGGVACVHDEPAVKEFFRRWFDEHGQMRSGVSRGDRGASGGTGQCLVTGRLGVRLAELHPKPKGIPPVRVTGRGVPLTSTNLPAFESYGLGRIGCAPISKDVARAIEVALTRLLDPAYPGPDGVPLPPRSILLKKDTVLVYWSPDGGSVDFLSGLDGGDPEKVRELFRSPLSGKRSVLEDASRFFALVLTGMTGRAIVRSLVQSTVGAVASNIDSYFREAEIVRPFGQGPGTYSLSRLRRALAAFEDLDRLPPQQGAELYLAILLGRLFPRSLLEAAARRNRADLIPKDEKGRPEEDVFAARCSLTKAYLCRNEKEEITVALDTKRRDPPYLLGRLLATLDKVQGEALGDVNATTVDRYYGSASTTPAAVFPTLVRRAQHHFGKLRRENTGLGIVRERLVQEITAELNNFPQVLNLESQGLFALGFYHQRQNFFTKAGDRQ